MEQNQGYRRPRRRRRRGLIGRLVSLLVIALGLFLGISVFFKLSVIEVAGQSQYSQEQIIQASGLDMGEHLFFINSGAVSANIQARLPYAEQVSISKQFPGTVEITVNDASALAVIGTDSGYLLINGQCKILEQVDTEGAQGKILVEGVVPILPEVGQTIALGEEEKSKVAYLADLLTALEEQGMYAEVGTIDMSYSLDVSFTYQDRFKVRLGTNKDLSYKLKLLEGALANLASYQTGTIDLSEDNTAIFSPD